MSVLKDLYSHVKNIVATKVTDVKHFDYWNNNIQNQDVETPYNTPAVFFEYSTVEWEKPSNGSFGSCTDKFPPIQGYVEFTLHVVIRKNESSDIDASELRHFDIVSALYQNIAYTKFDQIEGNILRIRDLDDNENRVLRDWQTTFGCNVIELGGTNIGDTIIDANDPIGTIKFETPVEPKVGQPFIDGDGKIHFNVK